MWCAHRAARRPSRDRSAPFNAPTTPPPRQGFETARRSDASDDVPREPGAESE
ncbi:hypothetical protein ACFFRL_15615 [Agromyces hippuratus]|uniref:hypothetical protein n=1 Tax=Agromyces hippuratus TaxID=286438 RepID=UPI0035E90579